MLSLQVTAKQAYSQLLGSAKSKLEFLPDREQLLGSLKALYGSSIAAAADALAEEAEAQRRATEDLIDDLFGGRSPARSPARDRCGAKRRRKRRRDKSADDDDLFGSASDEDTEGEDCEYDDGFSSDGSDSVDPFAGNQPEIQSKGDMHPSPTQLIGDDFDITVGGPQNLPTHESTDSLQPLVVQPEGEAVDHPCSEEVDLIPGKAGIGICGREAEEPISPGCEGSSTPLPEEAPCGTALEDNPTSLPIVDAPGLEKPTSQQIGNAEESSAVGSSPTRAECTAPEGSAPAAQGGTASQGKAISRVRQQTTEFVKAVLDPMLRAQVGVRAVLEVQLL